MNVTYICTPEDMKWLSDTHGINVDGFTCAIVSGNEDCPEMVEVFPSTFYDAIPTVYKRDQNGLKLYLASTK